MLTTGVQGYRWIKLYSDWCSQWVTERSNCHCQWNCFTGGGAGWKGTAHSPQTGRSLLEGMMGGMSCRWMGNGGFGGGGGACIAGGGGGGYSGEFCSHFYLNVKLIF